MNLKAILLFLVIITPVFADLDNTVKETEQGKFEQLKLKIFNVIDSAKAGDAKAQLKLGMMLTKGIWMKKDTRAAIDWWHKSAEQGNIKAQLLLGTVYLDGKRVEKDVEQSNYWFNKAIESKPALVKVVNKMKSLIADSEKKEKE